MKPEIIAIVAVFFTFAIVEFVRTTVLLVFTQPLVLLGGGLLAATLLPEQQGALATWPVLAQIGLLLVFDDMMQYWWHRISHSVKWLYELHRPHHDAEYMSIRIVYRNNVFYYLMMPGLWFSGALIYLGLGTVYAVYIVVKLLVICGAHSDVQWDRPLYKSRLFSPLMWVLERVISTPATHSAHHGRHKDDGVTHYKGNYGNLLFFWDVLFGTARITRQYPKKYGAENLEPVSAAHQLLWPLIRDKA